MSSKRLTAAADTSVALDDIQTLTGTSRLVGAARAILRASHCDSGDDDALRSPVQSSWLVTSIDRALISCGSLWKRALVESSLCSSAGGAVADRISFGGMALVAAVATNVMLAIGFGRPIGFLAWLFSAVCVAFGALCLRYPDRIAAAWNSWRRDA